MQTAWALPVVLLVGLGATAQPAGAALSPQADGKVGSETGEKDKQDRWHQLNGQALDLYREKQYEEGIPVAQEVLRLAEAAFGPEDLKVATSLANLATFYKAKARYGEAEPLWERAVRIREKALGPEHPEVATSLNHLALIYQEEGKYASAEPVLLRALSIREKVLGPEHPEVATLLNNLAAGYKQLGKYGEAEPLYLRAIRIREKALGAQHPDLVTSLGNLAALYDVEGKHAAAEPLLRRAIEIVEKTFGAEHPSLAPLLNNLAECYRAQGKYVEAIALYQRSIHIAEKSLGPEHPNVANSLDNLAGLYRTQGKYAEATPLSHRALQIREKTLGPEHPSVATSLNSVALLYEDEGRYAEAEQLLKRALYIREKAWGPEHPAVAQSLNNLARLYSRQGNYVEAERLYQRSLSILEKVLGPDHAHVAFPLDNLAGCYMREGQYAEAEALYLRALRIREKALGPEHPEVAITLANLAGLYKAQARYVDAEPLFQRALQIREKTLGPEHPQVATSLGNLGLLYQAEGKYFQAQPLFVRSFDVLVRQFQYHFTYMSEKDRLSFLETVANRFPMYFSFAHQFHDKDPELVDEMYDLLLWQKGFIVGSIAGLRRRVAASEDREALQLLDQLNNKRAHVAALLYSEPEDRSGWHRQVAQFQQEADDLERILVQRSAAFAQHQKRTRATWQQVRDSLPPDAAAVELSRFRFHDGKAWTQASYYAALVVTPETRDHPAYVLLGETKAIENAAAIEYKERAQTRGMQLESQAVAHTPQSLDQVFELLWKPLEPLLAGKTHIYLSPDGVFNRVPLGLVPAPDGKLLMEKYDLHLVSSTRDLLRTPVPNSSNTAVLIGDPAFDLAENRQRAALGALNDGQKTEPILLAALAPSGLSRDQGSGGPLSPLPGTGAEIHAVSRLLRQYEWQTDSYTGDRALEEVVKRVRGPRVLHLATHGFFLSDQQIKAENQEADQRSGLEDPMMRAGLYFAGADRARTRASTHDDLDDGIMTAYEAAGLNLQGTELVVLSACETGRGNVKNGEGVFGLRRAFQEAGAQSVMMSLWSVPDKETQELMALFYSKWLGGTEKHEALRQAQLEMREKVSQRYGRDLPYYWGAFVLVGR